MNFPQTVKETEVKIAGVSMTYNDEYKLKEWGEHYEEYKKELDYYVIVDNGSSHSYVQKLESTFPEAAIIRRNSNGGCTAAYNDGIRYILKNTDADAIVLIATDFKLCKGCLTGLYKFLCSDKKLGLVSSAVLVKDSMQVESYGHIVNNYKIIECDKGRDIDKLLPKYKFTDLVAGGFYMAKREFYEEVGLQDEKLFMYGDELDTAIRTKRAGYKLGVTCEVYGWHWHINEPNRKTRKPASNYLIARNRVYVVRKYYGIGSVILTFCRFSILLPIRLLIAGIIKMETGRIERAVYYFWGGVNGLIGNMEPNKYTIF